MVVMTMHRMGLLVTTQQQHQQLVTTGPIITIIIT